MRERVTASTPGGTFAAAAAAEEEAAGARADPGAEEGTTMAPLLPSRPPDAAVSPQPARRRRRTGRDPMSAKCSVGSRKMAGPEDPWSMSARGRSRGALASGGKGTVKKGGGGLLGGARVEEARAAGAVTAP